MTKKRAFDMVLATVGAVVWVPVVLGSALLVLVCSGRPVFYRSMRRVSVDSTIRVVKFRTMVRNAAEIANRETVPVDGSTRFLNIPGNSPLYTRIGRLLEKLAFTELPQFSHVLRGEMSVIGNRPLPQNVIDCLEEEFPNATDRFRTPAGLTGPSQLVGRDYLSDADRLKLEGAYCTGAQRNYSVRLDLLILIYTILVVLRVKKPFTADEVVELVEKYTGVPVPALTPVDAPVVLPAFSRAMPHMVGDVARLRNMPGVRTTNGAIAARSAAHAAVASSAAAHVVASEAHREADTRSSARLA